MFICLVFKQKTAYEMRISDLSSDVCSSDLALAKRHAFHTMNVIGGRRVKIEIRKRKGEQEMFSREGKGEVFETEDHLSIFVSIDFFRRDLPQRFLGIGNHLLQVLVSNQRNLGLGTVGAFFDGAQGADRKSTRLNSSHSCAPRMP